MPNHKPGSTHTFENLLKAYGADPQTAEDAHFLLWKGDEILALCLRRKFNPTPGEVWIGDDPVVKAWGDKLAALKGQSTVPLYFSSHHGGFYEFRGHHVITGDITAPDELKKRKGPVPLSRIVLVHPVARASA